MASAGPALALILAAVATAATAPDPGMLHAEHAPLAARSLLLDVARAGERLVAVGERGHVLLSDDAGQGWQQADDVPTQNLLTAVCFWDERDGLAVGHDEIILLTRDGGRTWTRQHYAPEAQQPLLDVWCGPEGRAIAVGAYSAYFTSQDRGEHWAQRKFDPKPLPTNASSAPEAQDEYFEDFGNDFHLNGIAFAPPSRLYLAAEAGHLYRSDDAGETWYELPSPYEGSFFGVTPLGGESVLAYGLRGRLYRSDDGGQSWTRIETGTVAMLNDAVMLPGGGVAVVGLAGSVLVSRDGREPYVLSQQSDRKGISAGLALQGGAALVTVGEGGVRRLPIELPGPSRVTANTRAADRAVAHGHLR